MKEKISITATFTIEYVPNPKHYPGCKTIDAMAKVDLKNFKQDPLAFLSQRGIKKKWDCEIVA